MNLTQKNQGRVSCSGATKPKHRRMTIALCNTETVKHDEMWRHSVWTWEGEVVNKRLVTAERKQGMPDDSLRGGIVGKSSKQARFKVCTLALSIVFHHVKCCRSFRDIPIGALLQLMLQVHYCRGFLRRRIWWPSDHRFEVSEDVYVLCLVQENHVSIGKIIQQLSFKATVMNVLHVTRS